MADTPMQARPVFPANEVPPLSIEKRNANTAKVLREYAEIIEDMIQGLLENPPAPALKLEPKERYQWFRTKIAETYNGDPFLIQAEIAILLDDTLTDRIKAAMQAMRQGVPADIPMLPASPPFVNYVPGMLLGFEAWRKWFATLHKQYGQENA